MTSSVLRPLPLLLLLTSFAAAGDGNRLTYLDESDPYYPHLNFPKLITPQWVGEPGVEAVVVLAIDDMRSPTKYEAYLRPILDRLKQIDGRAPVSIMTCEVDPNHQQLQQWLAEGLSLEVHTLTHPCPLLADGDIGAARRTYHGCVDQMASIPGNTPVAFRMPCCDSLNTPSPRFFSEIFSQSSPNDHALSIDSSVFCILTPDDPSLPRNLVLDSDGRERFRKYLPFDSFVNTIENYPYPYLINGDCWEFPCIVPSDWEAQNLHRPNNPVTVNDLEAALDAVVAKQGVFNLVFHPHGWIENTQVVELIDRAVEKHGKKVKFLTFKEALDRLNRHLLGGQPARRHPPRSLLSKPTDGAVRLLDLDDDGYLDILLGDGPQITRVWEPSTRTWHLGPLPTSTVPTDDSPVRFGIVGRDRRLVMFVPDIVPHAYEFTDGRWALHDEWLSNLPSAWEDTRFRDIDADGRCEALIAARGDTSSVYSWSDERHTWYQQPFRFPLGAFTSGFFDGDSGTRFVDVDEDGRDDIVFSHDISYGVYLFTDMAKGWSRKVVAGNADDPGALPPIARRPAGENNGFWAHSRHLWWQNEDTAKLPNLVDRRAFNDLLKDVPPRAKTPDASLKSLRVKPGYHVDLMASEPLLRDPVSFDWDEHGRLWVVEMGDYPLGEDGHGSPGGRVRFLEDTDNDGTYDRSTLFLDGLDFPTSVLPWRDGVLIASAPDILFARDTDGDGRCDDRQTILTGFAAGNPQHRVNGLELGLDGWVYGANGDSGGTISSPKTGQTLDLRGRDFRFLPDTGELKAESGQTQFGRHRDDFGHWFGGNNSVWGWHYVLADADLARNPNATYPSPLHVLEADTSLHPLSPTAARFNDFQMANRVTSANSTTPSRDDLLGLPDSLFVSEPVHNLLARLQLQPDGLTFSARRTLDLDRGEFLASSDPFFRPTTLRTGPDGGLWIADMYRAVIEHPEWIPDDWEARIDLREGSDLGRLYRVLPVGTSPRPFPKLADASLEQLADAFLSPNGWTRDTAQRLLLHRNDIACLPLLRDRLEKAEHPASRVQIAWTISCLGGSPPLGLFRDPDPLVRAQAIRALGSFPYRQSPVRAALIELGSDPDPRVRFQLALLCGNGLDGSAIDILADLARRDGHDPFFRAAILSSARAFGPRILLLLLSEGEPPPAEIVEPLLASLEPGIPDLDHLLEFVTDPASPTPAAGRLRFLHQLLAASHRHGSSLEVWAGLDADESARISQRLRESLTSARTVLSDANAPLDSRLAASSVLGYRPEDLPSDLPALASLLSPNTPSDLQQTALSSLSRIDSLDVPPVLLSEWPQHGPALRASVLRALLGRPGWTPALVDALERGDVSPRELSPTDRQALLSSTDPDLRRRAETAFGAVATDRQQILDTYRASLASPGDPETGRAVFRQLCAPCHRLGDDGHAVGPDLASLTDRSTEALLVAILDPNRAFESKFASYALATTDGLVLDGLIASETSTGLTLLRAEGQTTTVLRSSIDAIRSSGRSLMPDGLEKDLDPDRLRNLISFLQTLGPPPKQLPGNTPSVITPGPDGTLVLPASSAEIRGDTLTFEPLHSNLGYWSSPNDLATFRLDLPQAGTFDVFLTFACPASHAGGTLRLDAGPSHLDFAVPGTDSWDDYQTVRLGPLTLPSGPGRLELHSTGLIPQGALLDLQRLELRPSGPACCGQ